MPSPAADEVCHSLPCASLIERLTCRHLCVFVDDAQIYAIQRDLFTTCYEKARDDHHRVSTELELLAYWGDALRKDGAVFVRSTLVDATLARADGMIRDDDGDDAGDLGSGSDPSKRDELAQDEAGDIVLTIDSADEHDAAVYPVVGQDDEPHGRSEDGANWLSGGAGVRGTTAVSTSWQDMLMQNLCVEGDGGDRARPPTDVGTHHQQQ